MLGYSGIEYKSWWCMFEDDEVMMHDACTILRGEELSRYICGIYGNVLVQGSTPSSLIVRCSSVLTLRCVVCSSGHSLTAMQAYIYIYIPLYYIPPPPPRPAPLEDGVTRSTDGYGRGGACQQNHQQTCDIYICC